VFLSLLARKTLTGVGVTIRRRRAALSPPVGHSGHSRMFRWRFLKSAFDGAGSFCATNSWKMALGLPPADKKRVVGSPPSPAAFFPTRQNQKLQSPPDSSGCVTTILGTAVPGDAFLVTSVPVRQSLNRTTLIGDGDGLPAQAVGSSLPPLPFLRSRNVRWNGGQQQLPSAASLPLVYSMTACVRMVAGIAVIREFMESTVNHLFCPRPGHCLLCTISPLMTESRRAWLGFRRALQLSTDPPHWQSRGSR
jgi:hypothetical protein